MAEEEVKPRIVQAVGVSANANASGDWATAERQEQAMSEAAQQAHDDGITDPEEIKARMMAAREAVLNAPE